MKNFLCVLLAAAIFCAGRAGAATNTPAPVFDTNLPVRGFCISAPRAEDLETFISFIDKELAPRGVNTLILRVDYNYEFKSHPELREKQVLSEADVKKLVAVCRTNKIHLIPQINMLGHQSGGKWLGSLLRHYPEFDETPWVKMPEKYEWPNADYLFCKSYCPLHPNLHEIIFPIIDEICDAFESDTFHAGMDEVFYIAEDKCPRCGGKDPAEIFAGEVTRLRDHLQKSGRKLWIWSDRLLDGKSTGICAWEASANNTSRAIDLIPKDVMLCDWHYDQAVPTAPYFAMKGFHVITCPWKNSQTAVWQAQDMAHWRSRSTPELRERFEGVMQTVWSGTGGFLKKDYHSDPSQTNSWNCFTAMFDELKKLQTDAK